MVYHTPCVRYYFLHSLSFPKKKKWTGRGNKFPTSSPSFYFRGNESRMKRDHCIFPEARDWMSLNKRASWILFRNRSDFPTIFKLSLCNTFFYRNNTLFIETKFLHNFYKKKKKKNVNRKVLIALCFLAFILCRYLNIFKHIYRKFKCIKSHKCKKKYSK